MHNAVLIYLYDSCRTFLCCHLLLVSFSHILVSFSVSLSIFTPRFYCLLFIHFLTVVLFYFPRFVIYLSIDFPPVAWGVQNSANVCPCACRKRLLIMGYKLSYTTGLLYARSSCMQWGVWVRTVGHWVVLVQVIYRSEGGWVLFLKNQRHFWEEIMSCSHSCMPDLTVTHSYPLSTWLSVLLFFFSSSTKTTLSGQGCGFCWWLR